MKLGIVLSGGGAKGAYEAGFLKALAEFNIQPDVIAGTSIGSITGAVYVANKDIKRSAEIIENLWLELADERALQLKDKKITLLEVFSFLGIPESRIIHLLKKAVSKDGLLTNLPLVNRLQKYAPIEKIKNGLPFYVAYTKSYGNFIDTLHFLGLKHIEVEYQKIQQLNDEDIHKAIMASAALPILFEAVEVEGKFKRDGCLGSNKEELGNTPALPLVQDEKCTHLIVCHLNKGSLFNRLNPVFKNINIIEIRPNEEIFNSSLDPLMFKIEKIKKWIEAGYNDTKKILENIFQTLDMIKINEISKKLSNKKINELKHRNFKLDFEE